MKIIRFEDSGGDIRYGALQPDGSATVIEGDIFGEHRLSGRPADVVKLLTPIAPVNILCIGLNYRRHAEESKAPMPQYPVLFMKITGRRAKSGLPDRTAAAACQRGGRL